MKCKLPPVQRRCCKTCPFREGSPYESLVPILTQSALNEASRVCHSTGRSGLLGNTGRAERLCRGARDVQIQLFHILGVLDEPTDEAWAKAVKGLACSP